MVGLPRQTVMYCNKYASERHPGGFWYTNFTRHPEITRLHDPRSDVLKVKVSETSNAKGAYWAWWDNKEAYFELVYAAKSLLEMFFPCGTKPLLKSGRGLLLPVSIEVLEDKVKTTHV